MPAQSPARVVCPELRSPENPARGRMRVMETITREVDQMQAEERSAAELLIGRSLRGHERIILNVLEMQRPAPPADARPAQSI